MDTDHTLWVRLINIPKKVCAFDPTTIPSGFYQAWRIKEKEKLATIIWPAYGLAESDKSLWMLMECISKQLFWHVPSYAAATSELSNHILQCMKLIPKRVHISDLLSNFDMGTKQMDTLNVWKAHWTINTSMVFVLLNWKKPEAMNRRKQ